jgi:hypothetical protein
MGRFLFTENTMADDLDKFRPMDMTLDERIKEYINWMNDSSDKALVVDLAAELAKLRAEHERLRGQVEELIRSANIY